MPAEIELARPATLDFGGLLQLALEKEGNAEVIQQLADLQIKVMDREARNAYIDAFERFKRDVPPIVKDSAIVVNNQERGKYTKLDKICDVLVPALLRVEITHRWQTNMTDDGRMISVTCFLRHRMGHEERGSTIAGPPDATGSKNAIQAVGSTVSYLERYTLVASCGIAIKDQDNIDDGITPEMDDELQGDIAAIASAKTKKDAFVQWSTATAKCTRREDLSSAQRELMQKELLRAKDEWKEGGDAGNL